MNRLACPGIQTPAESRTPGLTATDVTILVSVADAKSTTPFHRSRLSTPLKPDGGDDGAGSAPAKYIVFAHAAHSDVSRSKCRREPAKLSVRKINRRAV